MTKKESVARHFWVSGRVHGVGYRAFAQEAAERLGLHGFVRNCRDGRVEVFAMGSAEQLHELRAELHKGPMMARVAGVHEEPAAVDAKYSGEFIVETTT